MKFIYVVVFALSKIAESYVVENAPTIPEVFKDMTYAGAISLVVAGDVAPMHPDNEVHADNEKSEAYQANLHAVQVHLKDLHNKWDKAHFNTILSRIGSDIHKEKFYINLTNSNKALEEYEAAQAEYEAGFPAEAADQESKEIDAILENEENATEDDINELISMDKKLSAAKLEYRSAIEAAHKAPSDENRAKEVETGIYYKDLLTKYWNMPEYSYEFTENIFNAGNANSEKDNVATAEDVSSN